jgi:DEAD/DEAH box helicase domain-containing protein
VGKGMRNRKRTRGESIAVAEPFCTRGSYFRRTARSTLWNTHCGLKNKAEARLGKSNPLSCARHAILLSPPVRSAIKWRGEHLFMKNIVYFDLETQKSAEEVGGWDKIARMGMSIGVTYSTSRGGYVIYGEKQVDELVRELQRADLIVGFNNLRFDYEVLHGYTALDLRQLPTLDMLVVLQNQLQHRLSLDSIATATFGLEKTAEGLQAIQWFKEGKLVEIAEYCCYDVKLTRLVHEFGLQNRQVHYHNRFGNKLTVSVNW